MQKMPFYVAKGVLLAHNMWPFAEGAGRDERTGRAEEAGIIGKPENRQDYALFLTFLPSHLFTPQSESSCLGITVITAVGDDEVVKKVDAHQLASLLHALRQTVVVTAGAGVAAGMVVAEGDDRGVA